MRAGFRKRRRFAITCRRSGNSIAETREVGFSKVVHKRDSVLRTRRAPPCSRAHSKSGSQKAKVSGRSGPVPRGRTHTFRRCAMAALMTRSVVSSSEQAAGSAWGPPDGGSAAAADTAQAGSDAGRFAIKISPAAMQRPLSPARRSRQCTATGYSDAATSGPTSFARSICCRGVEISGRRSVRRDLPRTRASAPPVREKR
mmetsp:Transcript_17049/g.48010  ORF Transcript_17049/g.48010 Transcript_17049/m.48010 type:complete len:200 (+) Transcript_17049:3261-3860(+)